MDVDEAVVLDEALCITNLLPKKSARYISRYECFCKDLKLAQAGRCSKRPCFTFFGTKLTTNRVRQHALGRHSTRGCSATTAASSTAA
jgi:cytochrome c oxidase assembly protein Cox11